MAYPPEHPLSVVAKEFGYSTAASLQVVCIGAGYKEGWDNLPKLRAFVKARKERIAAGKPAKGGDSKQGSGALMLNRNPLVATLADELFPALRDRAHARHKVRELLIEAKYRGPNDLGKMREAIQRARGDKISASLEPVPVVVPTAMPTTEHNHEASQAQKRLKQVEMILEQIDHEYHRKPPRKGHPLIGLCLYALGICRGEVGQ